MQSLAADDPAEIGPYRLLRRLGAGGMGRVYLARSANGRTVAVKVVHPHFAVDEQFRTRFKREVASARRVAEAAGEEEWTAPVLDADPEATVPWVATGYVAGPPLHSAVAENGPLPRETVHVVGARLARALHQVHELNLVHRDVKPSNVLLTLDGPRLIDFGIARATDGTASLTATGASVGSPGYMSPEQVLGRTVTGASDVFSLGAVLAYAATSGAPFPGDNSATLLYRVVHEEPELEGLEGELREIVGACLAKESADRPTPQEISERLAGTSGGAVGPVPSGWLPGPIVEEVSRHAVALLNLETPPERPAAGSGETGPVPFTHQAQGPGVPTQGFGPPDPAYASATPPAADSRGGATSSAEQAGGPGTPPPGFGPPPSQPGTGHPGGPGGPGGPGTPEGPEGKKGKKKGKRRRRGCLIAVVIVCLLPFANIFNLPLSLASNLLFPSGGSSDDGAAEEPPADEESSGPSEVPDAFLGTWKGTVTARKNSPARKLTVTIKQAEQGSTVATGSVEVGNEECAERWELDSASDRKLSAKSAAERGAQRLCSTGDDTFTLRGNQLRYSSDDKGAGNPKGMLVKAE